MSKKALFFDIDGTILSDITGTVPKSTYAALQRALERGHLTFINTGRTISSVPSELKELPFSGYICGCGTYITCENEILYSRRIPHERGREMLEIMKKYHAVPVLEAQEDCYFPREMTRFAELEQLRRYFYSRGMGKEKFVEDDGYDYDKYIFYYDEQTDMEALRKELGMDMQLIDREGDFFEAVPKGCSKAGGIAFVMEKFGINMDDVYVFGDSSNDLPMFEFAKHTIAMGVHHKGLEPYTEFVTKTVEEGGIAFAMEHYGLI